MKNGKGYIVEAELKKSDITNSIDEYIRTEKFKKKVEEVCEDVISTLFRNMWQRKNMWK